MKYLFIVLVLLFIQTASAIRINEVELNPVGDDAGNEWVELYNRGEVSLDNYRLVNNDGDKIKLSGSFDDDYYVYVFEKQWLDNTDEKIFLYDGEKIIDETDLLEDNENNDKTWNYCTKWKFGKSTKDEKNECWNDDKKGELTTEVIKNNEMNETESEPQILEPINLNPKTIKTKNNKESSNKNYVAYVFVGLCILLVFLFILKIRRNRLKNEFEK